MRTLIAVVGLAVLILGATSASAYRVDMEWVNPQVLTVSDTARIQVWLDTEGAGDIAILGVGVVFDWQELTYDQAASSTTSYLLYTTAKAPYLQAASTCGGGYGSPNAGDGCIPYGLDPYQVQLDFISNSLPAGVPGTGVAMLAELVFHVHSVGDGLATLSFRFSGAMGGILQLGDTTQPGLTLGPDILLIPEPTTALLIGLGLFGLGVASHRGRVE